MHWAPGFGTRAAEIAATSLGALTLAGEAASSRRLASPLVLWLDADGLSLRQTGPGAMGPVACEFVAGRARHRRLYGGGKSQTIAKAVGIRNGVSPTVTDLTAGLGQDAFVLASLGCKVTMVERHPVIAALVRDGLHRARLAAGGDRGFAEVVGRLALEQQSALEWLAQLGEEERPEVIYLDPMFPERRKSAQVNKNMQVFQHLVGGDPDADLLLPAALEKALFRVVVKRPSHAPWLAGREPPLSFTGKSVRFDVYPLRTMARR